MEPIAHKRECLTPMPVRLEPIIQPHAKQNVCIVQKVNIVLIRDYLILQIALLGHTVQIAV